MVQLVDRFGKPMTSSRKALSEEVARPGMTGVRQAWSAETAVSGLTPDKLAAIIRQADQGDMDAFLTLAEEMEERDPHYGSVLQTRKLAVTGLERKLTWRAGAEKHPKADEIMEACEGLIAEPAFEDLLLHLLDAIAKGFAAPEIIWDTSKDWRPIRYEWRDPRWFQFDRDTGRELRLKEPGHVDGQPLPPFKFVRHLAGRKSGLPARAGLARLVAFSFVCKLYGLKDWMAYAEIFGIPLRLGRYDGSASADDVAVLKRAVFGLGSDAAAVIPKSMDIEFPELGKATGGAELFERLVMFLDNQVSKAVLGQTGTTDMQKGGGFAQSTVLNEVRGDLTKADARGVNATVTGDVLTPFVRFNYGPDAPVPQYEAVVEDPEDTEALSKALERLVPLGLKVGQAEVRRKLKVSDPDDDDELLTPPAAARAEPPPVDESRTTGAPPAANDADPEAEEEADRLRQAQRRDRKALAREAASGREDQRQRREDIEADIDGLVAGGLDGWERTFGLEADLVMAVVRSASSFDEISAGLHALARDLSAPPAARSLARSMFMAAAIGEEAGR